MAPDVALPDVFRVIDLIGVFINGTLGGMLARDKRFDAIGFAILAIISALGGGMLRDTLLQAGPPVALTDPTYLATALAGAGVAFVLQLRGRLWNRAFLVGDAVALGAWAATGAAKTLGVGLGWLPAIMLGVVTAVGGGMIRDIAVGRVPVIFGGNTLYATAALAGAITLVLFPEPWSASWGMVVATAVGAGLCILARWRNWSLPEPGDWSITLTSDQLRRLLRRRRDEPPTVGR